MLKFIKHHMESIIGIEVFPITSLLIFFVFFSLVTFYAFYMHKNYVEHMSNLPLEDFTDTEKEQ